jgi:hypothetical protein
MSRVCAKTKFQNNKKHHVLRLYAYADETGQDTIGSFFLVCILVSQQEKISMYQDSLLKIESMSGKRAKWSRASFEQKINYIKGIADLLKHFKGDLFFKVYYNTIAYVPLIALGVGEAIICKTVNNPKYRVQVIIDGLKEKERDVVKKEFRNLHIRFTKIKIDLREEQDVYLRLVDCLAGFLRDYTEQQTYAKKLYREYKFKEIITELTVK